MVKISDLNDFRGDKRVEINLSRLPHKTYTKLKFILDRKICEHSNFVKLIKNHQIQKGFDIGTDKLLNFLLFI